MFPNELHSLQTLEVVHGQEQPLKVHIDSSFLVKGEYLDSM